ncbi:hypothetical protein Tco_0445032 [Tanacetum coccineum]
MVKIFVVAARFMKCVSEDSGDELKYLREILQVMDTDCGLFPVVGASFTQGTIPSIPIGGSISLEGFLLLVLLLVNHALLSDPLISGLCWWLPPKFEASRLCIRGDFLEYSLNSSSRSGVPVLSAFAMVAACASRATIIPSVISYWMAAKVMAGVSDVDVLFSSGTKKYRGSNSSDGGNTGDGVKIVGGVMGSGDEIEQLEGDYERLYDDLLRLKTSFDVLFESLWCRGLYGAKEEDVAIFKTKKWVKPKSKNAKVRVNTEESAVKPEPELKNTIRCNLPSTMWRIRGSIGQVYTCNSSLTPEGPCGNQAFYVIAGSSGQRIVERSSDLGFRYEIEIASGQLVEIDKIMPPKIRTRSAGQLAIESLGGGTGVWVGRGGRGRRPREGNDEHVDDLNGQGNDQEPLTHHASSVNGNRVGCSYKEFLACNPKEYDGKGGVVVLTRWIEKMESVHDMSGWEGEQLNGLLKVEGGRRPREGNDERVNELNGQGNDLGLEANGGVEGVNVNIEGAIGGAPDFSMIIA